MYIFTCMLNNMYLYSVFHSVLSCMDVLITGGKDGSMIVWSSRIMQPLHSINAHNREIITMATHPTKPHLYTSSSDGCIKVWDMTTLTEMYQFYTSESNLMDFNLCVGSQALCYSSKTVMILNISMVRSRAYTQWYTHVYTEYVYAFYHLYMYFTVTYVNN